MNVKYMKESWVGDSRDGKLANGEGQHIFKLQEDGLILEAYEFYEADDGNEVVTRLPEMQGVNWKTDLGFDDFTTLEEISESEFDGVAGMAKA